MDNTTRDDGFYQPINRPQNDSPVPDDPPSTVDPTHPVTDTDVDISEVYDAGLDEATGASDPLKK